MIRYAFIAIPATIAFLNMKNKITAVVADRESFFVEAIPAHITMSGMHHLRVIVPFSANTALMISAGFSTVFTAERAPIDFKLISVRDDTVAEIATNVTTFIEAWFTYEAVVVPIAFVL